MKMRQSHTLVLYLMLALVLSAIFLAFMYASDLRLTDDPEPEAAISSTGPVVRSPPPDHYEQRFRQLEQWLGQTQDAYESRFAQLEQRLAQTTSRLDELSVSLIAPTDDKDTIVAANKALLIAPPGAPGTQPVAGASQARPPPQISRAPETGASTAPTPEPEPEPKPETEDKHPGDRTAHSPGKWVINLASYVSKKTATRHMDSFQKKGVAAEMVSADVHGRTIYRVRLAGFDTLEAAKAMAPKVERQLSLKETWIMATNARRP